MQYLSIAMPVRLWQRVDGGADNSAAVDVVEGIMESVIAGACVRDAGWRAAAAHPESLDQFGWPPPEQPLAITLRRSHWEWVLSQLERWAPFEPDAVLIEARDLIDGALRAA
jgi:hypothetical protein